MQGQKGVIGFLPESLDMEHGSNSSDSGVVEQQVCWTNFIRNRNPSADANQETQNLSMWSMGESSSSTPNQVFENRVDSKIGHGWSSLVKAHPEPNQHEPLACSDANMYTSHTHANNGYNVSVNPSTLIGMKPSSYASSSTGPVQMEARQLPCKRKAYELNIGQSSSGIESASIFQMPDGCSSSVWQSLREHPTPTNTMPYDPTIPRLGSRTRGVDPTIPRFGSGTRGVDPTIPRLGSGIRGVSADSHAIENFRKNVRIRINNSCQQDQSPASNGNNNNGLLSFSSPYTSLGLHPLATTGDSSSSREGQPILRVPAFTRNRSSSSRVNRPVSTNIIGGSGDNSRTTPTNISDQPLFVQPHNTGNTAQTAINLDSFGGNRTRNRNVTTNGNRNRNGNGIASSPNPMPNLGPHHASSLSSRRRSEALRRALLSSIDSGAHGGGGQHSNLFSGLPPPMGASASSQETAIPPVTGQRQHHHLPHSRTSDRQLDGAFGIPNLARTVAGGSERRGRLSSEIRSVLDRLRRGEGLRYEDAMILNQSFFYGMAGIHDRHRDMRLDIDNMSYEELLALEERIGNVNTGLTEENVHKYLKQKTYTSVAGQPDDEPCCICQEEYKNGDDLGALECKHEFHTSCIKQWLLKKNSCPVCKSAASK